MSLEEIRQNAYNELDKLGYTKLFDKRPKDAIPPIWEDLWFLYQKVRERRPVRILEFGSGCSTLILTLAAHDNGCGIIDSCEDGHLWYSRTRELLEIKYNLITKVHWSGCYLTEYDGVTCYYYDRMPILDPDFIYLDGPELINAKVTLNPLLAVLKKGFYMVVDGRWETVNFLEKHLKGKYDIQRNHEENRTTFERIG